MSNTYFTAVQIADVDSAKATPRYAGDICVTKDTGKFYFSSDGSTWVEKSATGATGSQGPKGDTGNTGAPGSTGSQGPQGNAGSNGSQGAQGIQGIQGPAGNNGSNGTNGTNGASGGSRVLHPPFLAASAVATNLALNTFSAVSDPNYRQMTDLRGLTKVRIQGRIGGSLVAATKLRVQYHIGGNPAVATGDGGWTTLADSAGSHTVNVMFYSAEIAVPAGAQINDVQIRVGLFSGDGAADPTISACVLNFYP